MITHGGAMDRAVAEEREACAKIVAAALAEHIAYSKHGGDDYAGETLRRLAREIRARGKR